MKKITTMKDIEEKNREKSKIIRIYGPKSFPPMPNLRKDNFIDPIPSGLKEDLVKTIGEVDELVGQMKKRLNPKSKWYHKVIIWLVLIAMATGLIWVIKFFILKII